MRRIIPIAIVLSLLSIIGLSLLLTKNWDVGREPQVPEIAYPARLDLGVRELGELVVQPFDICNIGGGILTVDRIQSNCSCTGMEQIEAGTFQAVGALRLGPGERAALVMRISVRGAPVGAQIINAPDHRGGHRDAS